MSEESNENKPARPHGPKSIRKKERHELMERERAYGCWLGQIRGRETELVKNRWGPH